MTVDQISESGTITHHGPVSGVQIHAHMEFGPCALTVPLDTKVVIQLMFMFAEQTRLAPGADPVQITPKTVLERLRALGIVSGNGSRLVGRDAVYDSFTRLQAKGYLRRIELRKDNKAAGVAYEFYDFPAWNPEPPDLTSSQVGAASGNAGSGNAGSSKENRTKSASPQVRPASGNAGSGIAGSRSKKTASPQVGAASGNAGSPPHPPVGGGNTSPNPHKSGRAAKWAASCALAPEDYTPTAEEIAAADAFLQDLPDRWQMNVEEARALAPLLASRVHALGLGLDLMLRLELVQDDPNNPVRVPARVMPVRIRGLKRRRTVDAGEGGTAAGLAEWCTKCNRGEFPMMAFQRTVELPDGTDVPCRDCHPKYARA
ncbi:hypothetical protein [Streptomyces sp. NPDC095817]|uniref:hypothetical protein n=1 Tax=Streptomyces sp. NPDC095817 TaxID=3155082 RepID=UPI0033211B14